MTRNTSRRPKGNKTLFGNDAFSLSEINKLQRKGGRECTVRQTTCADCLLKGCELKP